MITYIVKQIYNIYKRGLENFEMHVWENYRTDFAFFGLSLWSIQTVQVRLQVLGYKKFQFFGSASI